MLKDRIKKAKQVVKDYAPVITATSSVLILTVMIRNIESTNRNIIRAQTAIPEMVKGGKPFTYYPQIGFYYDDPEDS